LLYRFIGSIPRILLITMMLRRPPGFVSFRHRAFSSFPDILYSFESFSPYHMKNRRFRLNGGIPFNHLNFLIFKKA
jgi:hypothetical protein